MQDYVHNRRKFIHVTRNQRNKGLGLDVVEGMVITHIYFQFSAFLVQLLRSRQSLLLVSPKTLLEYFLPYDLFAGLNY